MQKVFSGSNGSIDISIEYSDGFDSVIIHENWSDVMLGITSSSNFEGGRTQLEPTFPFHPYKDGLSGEYSLDWSISNSYAEIEKAGSEVLDVSIDGSLVKIDTNSFFVYQGFHSYCDWSGTQIIQDDQIRQSMEVIWADSLNFYFKEVITPFETGVADSVEYHFVGPKL